MKVKISKWGNSLAVRLPKHLADELSLGPGKDVEIARDGTRLTIETAQAPRMKIPHYRLEDLIAEMDRLGPENEPATVEWGPDRGSEIIDDAYSRGEITLEDILSRQPASKSRKLRNEPSGKAKANAPGRRRHRMG